MDTKWAQNLLTRPFKFGMPDPGVKIPRGHDHSINSVAFSPDGSKIFSGSLDKTIRVWKAMLMFHGWSQYFKTGRESQMAPRI
jgi:WD40 repeat protein